MLAVHNSQNPCTFLKLCNEGSEKLWYQFKIPGRVSGIRIQGEIGLGSNFNETEPGAYFTTVRRIILDSGLNVLDDDLELGFDNQEDGAFSLNFILAESHLHIHTWPELGLLQYDINTCNYLNNNDEKARQVTRKVIGLFGANWYRLYEFHTIVDTAKP